MLKPGGKGGDQYEIDANGNIVPRTAKPKSYYSVEWNNGVPHQVSHAAGPAATPPVWDASAQSADDAASTQWSNYLNSLPGMGEQSQSTPAATPAAAPAVSTSSTLLNGTTPSAAPMPAPQPQALNPSTMARHLSPQTMVSMKSPLQNGLFGRPLWKTGQKGLNL